MSDWIKIMRPRQWIKNGFVLLPLIFGRKLGVIPETLMVLVTVLAFCAAASAVYLLNDIVDRENDTRHAEKSSRPVASGRLGIACAQRLALAIAVLGFGLSLAVSPAVFMVLLVYGVLNVFYTLWLKHLVIVDVFCLAVFFLLRVLAGAVAAAVQPSHWLIFMSVLLAMFLGFNKRRQEVAAYKESGGVSRPVLAAYDTYFLDQMIAVLTGSIVVVYMLYTVDPRTVQQFGTTGLIYTIPFVYYGIFRYLFLVHKKRMGEDPVVVLLSDRPLILNLMLWLGACGWVIYGR